MLWTLAVYRLLEIRLKTLHSSSFTFLIFDKLKKSEDFCTRTSVMRLLRYCVWRIPALLQLCRWYRGGIIKQISHWLIMVCTAAIWLSAGCYGEAGDVFSSAQQRNSERWVQATMQRESKINSGLWQTYKGLQRRRLGRTQRKLETELLIVIDKKINRGRDDKMEKNQKMR